MAKQVLADLNPPVMGALSELGIILATGLQQQMFDKLTPAMGKVAEVKGKDNLNLLTNFQNTTIIYLSAKQAGVHCSGSYGRENL